MTMENTKTMELNEQELENITGGIDPGALLKSCLDAAIWAGKKVWKLGSKFADWEDNGCEIKGKKYCE